jgi:hypothetical protein
MTEDDKKTLGRLVTELTLFELSARKSGALAPTILRRDARQLANIARLMMGAK